MKDVENKEEGKPANGETVNLIISRQVLDFVDFYAEIGGMSREELLSMIITARIQEIKEQFKTLPFLHIPELY